MAYLVSDFWPPKQRQVVRTQPQIKPQIQRVNCIRVPSWRNQIRRNISTEVKAAQFIETESNFIFMQEGREKQYAVFFLFFFFELYFNEPNWRKYSRRKNLAVSQTEVTDSTSPTHGHKGQCHSSLEHSNI